MKKITIVIALLMGACTPKPETMVPKIQMESQIFLDAINTCNADVATKMLNENLVAAIKMKMGDWLKMRKQGYRTNGFAFQSAMVGIPEKPQLAGGKYVSFVPVRTTVVADDGGNIGQMRIFGPNSVTIESYLVAVSDNKGNSWKFFEAGESRQLSAELLPGIAEKLVFPAQMIKATPN